MKLLFLPGIGCTKEIWNSIKSYIKDYDCTGFQISSVHPIPGKNNNFIIFTSLSVYIIKDFH